MELLCPLCSADFTDKNDDFKGHIREFHKVEFRGKGIMTISGKLLPTKIQHKIRVIERKLNKGKPGLKIDIKNKKGTLIEGLDHCYLCKVFYSKLYVFKDSNGKPIKLCNRCVAKLRPLSSKSIRVIYTAFESKK